jgi:Restriction endonuclease/Topoisomerase DNA binding C4 zinc finger
MDSRKKFNFSDFLTVAFWGTFIFAWLGSKISSKPYAWLFYVIIGWVMIFTLGYLWRLKNLIGNKIHETKAAKERCPHGVVGGRIRLKNMLGGGSQLKCAQCNQDEIAAKRKEQAEQLRREAAEKIWAAADKLKTDEYARLTKLRTHKIEFLLRLTPGEFEEIVGDMYRKFGYEVERTPMTNDFGRDLILKKDGKKTFVECKRYDRDSPIGRRPLQLFYGVMVNMKADAGIFVTTSSFAKTAVNFAGETGIKLIDGYELAALMTQAFPGDGSADEYRAMCRECGDVVAFNLRDSITEMSCKNSHIVKNDSPDSLVIKLIAEAPVCEKCGAKLRQVSGRFGKFWGCSNYPKCRNKKRFFVR